VNDDLRYPVGRFVPPASVSDSERARFIETIAALPARMCEAVRGLDDARLETPYRPGGWTVRQVVHHVPDSHLNAYIRFRLALTEETPTIRPYDQARWAELPDAKTGPIAWSLDLLDTVHTRWTALLRAMRPADFARGYHHPEQPGRVLPLSEVLASYAWHSGHHLAHITRLRERMGWTG
jgi:hypothetical protein